MFPFRKKPPTKAEIIKHRVARGLIDAGKKLDQTPIPEVHIDVEGVRRQARAGALQAAQTAGQALQEVSERAEVAGGVARDRARELAGGAKESAQAALEVAGDRAARAASATSDAAGRAAHQAGQALQDAAHQASDQTGRALHDAAQGAGDAIGRLRGRAVKSGKEAGIAVASPEVRISESGSKWLWILLGLAAGGFATLIFLPAAGRRNRAVRDRLNQVRAGETDAVTTASDKAAELESRPGACAEAETLGAEANDALLTDRVQSVLGQLPALEHIEGLNVQIEKGVVVLRGDAPSAADCHAIEAAARGVPGVKDVRSEFKTDKVTA